jgi:hypothetical protein
MKDIIINYIKNNTKEIIYVLLFLLFLLSVSGLKNHLVTCYKLNYTTDVLQKEEVKADYKSDMGFLECIGVQHSCIYSNIDNGKDIIIQNCKGENFCNETYNNSINVPYK